MMTAIWNHCLGFMATILLRIDAAAEPVLKNDGLLIVIALTALILGPLLTFANLKLRARASEELLDSLEHSHGYYGILSRLFYYPVVFSTSLLCALSGQGSNAGIFQGMASSDVRATLSNFPEWNDTCKYFLIFLFLYAALKIFFSVLKLRFFRLLRFCLHTINCVTLGFLAANVYMASVDASRGNFLMTLVSLAVGLCMYSVFIVIFIGMAAPLVLIVMPLIAPFIGPLALLCGLSPCFVPVKYDNDLDLLGHFMLVHAWADLFSA